MHYAAAWSKKHSRTMYAKTSGMSITSERSGLCTAAPEVNARPRDKSRPVVVVGNWAVVMHRRR